MHSHSFISNNSGTIISAGTGDAQFATPFRQTSLVGVVGTLALLITRGQTAAIKNVRSLRILVEFRKRGTLQDLTRSIRGSDSIPPASLPESETHFAFPRPLPMEYPHFVPFRCPTHRMGRFFFPPYATLSTSQRSPDAMDLKLGFRVIRFPGEQAGMM